MAVLLPLSLSLPHPTHLSPFRFRGFINIASLQGRSVHPLGIPVCLCSLFFSSFFFSSITAFLKTSTNDPQFAIASFHLSAEDSQPLIQENPVPLIYGGSQAVCRNSFAFQTSPHLYSALSYLITRTREMKEGHKVPPCHRRTLTSPQRQSKTEQLLIPLCLFRSSSCHWFTLYVCVCANG